MDLLLQRFERPRARVEELKSRVSEHDNYENFIAHLKTSFGSRFGLNSIIYNNFVVPIHFSKGHRNMPAYAKKLMEYGNGVVAINPKHTKLITGLRTAIEKGKGTLDKESKMTEKPRREKIDLI